MRFENDTARARKVQACYAAEAKWRKRANGGDKKSAKVTRERLENPAKSDEANLPHPIRDAQARDKAEEVCDVSSRYVQDAKKLSQEAPSLFEKVKVGAIKLHVAMSALKRKEEDPDAWTMLLDGKTGVPEFNARCDLKRRAADLWNKVRRGKLGLDEVDSGNEGSATDREGARATSGNRPARRRGFAAVRTRDLNAGVEQPVSIDCCEPTDFLGRF